MRQKLLTVAIGVFGFLGVAQADIFTPSVQDQIKLGNQEAERIRKEMKVLPDNDPRVKELRRIGEQIVSMIPKEERDKKPFQYTFDVIDSEELNAFALPGGPIFFYSGLLETMEYEDEVAAILGHEITHVHNEHWARQYAGTLRRRVGIIAILTLLQANDDWFTVASMADSLAGLKYSRSDELESDKKGFEWMVKADYNPKGMIRVFETLKKASGSGSPEFLSTHPDSGNRAGRIQEWMTEDRVRYPALRPRKVTETEVRWENGYPRLLRKGGKAA